MVDMPKLIIILGAPASGKTHLARRLAGDLQVPLLSKDDVKEALFDVLGPVDQEGSRRFSEASFATVLRLARRQLDARLSCVIEGNWRSAHTAAVREILEATGAKAAQIACSVEMPELVRRFRSRIRHPGHMDCAVSNETLNRMSDAQSSFLDLAGLRWTCDAGDPRNYDELLGMLKFGRL